MDLLPHAGDRRPPALIDRLRPCLSELGDRLVCLERPTTRFKVRSLDAINVEAWQPEVGGGRGEEAEGSKVCVFSLAALLGCSGERGRGRKCRRRRRPRRRCRCRGDGPSL